MGHLSTLDDTAKSRLLAFLGHGNLRAPCWFVGMEEGIDERGGSLEQNLTIRSKSFGETMCLHESVRLLGSPITATKRPRTPVWPWMSKIVRALVHHAEDWRDPKLARSYITERLGKLDGDCFMTELLPLPRSRDATWHKAYSAWWPSAEVYERSVLSPRIALLRSLFAEHRPRWVIAYGARHHGSYRALFADRSWEARGKLFIARSGDAPSFIALTPFLGNGAFGEREVEQLVREAACGGP